MFRAPEAVCTKTTLAQIVFFSFISVCALWNTCSSICSTGFAWDPLRKTYKKNQTEKKMPSFDREDSCVERHVSASFGILSFYVNNAISKCKMKFYARFIHAAKTGSPEMCGISLSVDELNNRTEYTHASYLLPCLDAFFIRSGPEIFGDYFRRVDIRLPDFKWHNIVESCIDFISSSCFSLINLALICARNWGPGRCITTVRGNIHNKIECQTRPENHFQDTQIIFPTI